MGWRFFRRVRLGGGLNLNLGRGGAGLSWGIPGLRVGVSPAGRRYVSVGLPGTGLYYVRYIGGTSPRARR